MLVRKAKDCVGPTLSLDLLLPLRKGPFQVKMPMSWVWRVKGSGACLAHEDLCSSEPQQPIDLPEYRQEESLRAEPVVTSEHRWVWPKTNTKYRFPVSLWFVWKSRLGARSYISLTVLGFHQLCGGPAQVSHYVTPYPWLWICTSPPLTNSLNFFMRPFSLVSFFLGKEES